jgi:hypothetical protein
MLPDPPRGLLQPFVAARRRLLRFRGGGAG